MMDTSKISAGTIARTIILLLALVNQCLTMAGIQTIPVVDEDINTIVATVWTVVSAIVAWWKNNSFTSAAIEADKGLKQLKGG